MATEHIEAARGPVSGTVRPPGSKSLTNRALVAACLAEGRSTLRGCLASDDTRYMTEAWRKLGAEIEWPEEEPGGTQSRPRHTTTASPGGAGGFNDNGTDRAEPCPYENEQQRPDRDKPCPYEGKQQRPVHVRGTGGRLAPGPLELFVGNAGTAMRFLTAVVAAGRGEYRLDGVPRMRERPIEDLLAALGGLGVEARSALGTGCPPVEIRAAGLRGGRVTVSGKISSQYLSGLLLAAPLAQSAVAIEVDGDLVSKPYAAMTCRLMADFGVEVVNGAFRRFEVRAPQRYVARDYDIEPDATAATYFWAAAALTGGAVTVAGLSPASSQGDVGFVEVLRRMGCRSAASAAGLTVVGPERLRGVTADLNEMPDTALTLAVLALFAEGETVIANVANLHFKETDRLAALATELRKFGAAVEELSDGLRIVPPHEIRAARVETYEDHRLAMSFALAGLGVGGVEILGAECVSKTFPDYFAALRRLMG